MPTTSSAQKSLGRGSTNSAAPGKSNSVVVEPSRSRSSSASKYSKTHAKTPTAKSKPDTTPEDVSISDTLMDLLESASLMENLNIEDAASSVLSGLA